MSTSPSGSRHDGTAKRAIVGFVTSAAVEGAPGFVPLGPGRHHLGGVRGRGRPVPGVLAPRALRPALRRPRPPADAGVVRPPQDARSAAVRLLGRRARLHAGDLRGPLGPTAGERDRLGPGVRLPGRRAGPPGGPARPRRDRARKPEHLLARTGRLPCFAAGNDDADVELLESARFALLVVHDDEVREYACTDGAERARARAETAGWTKVSVKNDWKTVFGERTVQEEHGASDQ